MLCASRPHQARAMRCSPTAGSSPQPAAQLPSTLSPRNQRQRRRAGPVRSAGPLRGLREGSRRSGRIGLPITRTVASGNHLLIESRYYLVGLLTVHHLYIPEAHSLLLLHEFLEVARLMLVFGQQKLPAAPVAYIGLEFRGQRLPAPVGLNRQQRLRRVTSLPPH